MASSRFLLKTELAGLTAVDHANRPLLDQFDTLRDLLDERAGRGASALFAEPIVTWANGANTGSVSWYANASGDPRKLTELRGEERARYEAQLREKMAALAPLLQDANSGPMLRAALTVPSLSDVLIVNGNVLLTGWGLAPASLGKDKAALANHLQSVMGTFLPNPLANPDTGANARTVAVDPPTQRGGGASLSAATVAGPRAAAPGGPSGGGAGGGGGGGGGNANWDFTPGHVPTTPGSAWSWWFLPIGVLLSVLFLALGFYLGWRLIAERVAGMDVTATIVDQAKINQQLGELRERQARLRKELEEARAKLQGNVCTDTDPQGGQPGGGQPPAPQPGNDPAGSAPGGAPGGTQPPAGGDGRPVPQQKI